MIPTTMPFSEWINVYCEEMVLPHELVLAIIFAESGGNPWVCRFEPAWKYNVTPEVFAMRLRQSVETEERQQMTSWSLMQIMGGRARELGFGLELTRLIQPQFAILYGCKHLKSCFDKYGQDLDKVIASYNSGSPRYDCDGRLVNQNYVDKVKAIMTKISVDIQKLQP